MFAKVPIKWVVIALACLKEAIIMSTKQPWITIQSYKHNGTLHRCWENNLLIHEDEDFFIVASIRAKVTEADGRRWYTREPAITFFSKKEWWNAIGMMKEDGISFYTNIASPTLLDGTTLKYIDYDLDIKMYTDNSMKILDEKEYRRHRSQYDYGRDLDIVLKHQMRIVVAKMKSADYPFQAELVEALFEQYRDLTKKTN